MHSVPAFAVKEGNYADFSYFDDKFLPIAPKRMRAMIVRFIIFLLLLPPVGLCAQISNTPHLTVPETFRHFGNRERDRIFTDFGNLYNQNNVKNFGIVLLGAGVVANTKMDSNFQDWHGRHIRSDFSDDLSGFSKFFGEGIIFIPVMVTTACVYRFRQERRALPDCVWGEFADRTMRGYLVGTPTLLSLQLALGGDRPNGGSSQWRPFHRPVGVSGHAFVGAVPFMTAAQMTDRPIVKGLFYTLSTFCAWSRVNDDQHYLSQAVLGWYLAYLSVRAVSQTESRSPLPRGLTIFPVSEVGLVGAGAYYRY